MTRRGRHRAVTPTRLLAIAMGAVALVLAGCAGTNDWSGPSSGSAASAAAEETAGTTPTVPGETSSADVSKPVRGTCWAVSPDNARDPGYWFDDSPAVPCTEPHTTQTAFVVPLAEPTIEKALEQASACWDNVRVFLGVNPRHWVPWGFLMFLPSKEEIRDGASWVRCDAFFPASWDFGEIRSIRSTGSTASGIAVDPPTELWACLDQDPSRSGQPLVPCEQPHQYEQTGTLAIIGGLDGVEEYPTPAEREAAAQEQCAPADTGQGGRGTAVTASWDPSSALQDSTQIAGACFVFNTNGDPLPPRVALRPRATSRPRRRRPHEGHLVQRLGHHRERRQSESGS